MKIWEKNAEEKNVVVLEEGLYTFQQEMLIQANVCMILRQTLECWTDLYELTSMLAVPCIMYSSRAYCIFNYLCIGFLLAIFGCPFCTCGLVLSDSPLLLTE